MISNGRKTIGVFISEVYEEFRSKVSEGIIRQAEYYGYNVILFTSFGGYNKVDSYDEGELNIINLPSFEKLDGIIVVPETFSINKYKEKLLDKIEKEANCPVVSIRKELDEYYNVLVDDNRILENIIRHFIVDHKFREISLISGPKGQADMEKRVESYRRILREYGIPIDEDRIYHCDLRLTSEDDLTEEFLSINEKLPEAVVCAADYIASKFSRVLIKNGIRIPEDVAISGCDNMQLVEESYLGITTEDVPFAQMGVEAVKKIYKGINGINQERNTYIKTTTIYRDSCGCDFETDEEGSLYRLSQYDRLLDLERQMSSNIKLSTELTGLESINELVDKTEEYVREKEGMKDFYMCLRNNWQKYSENPLDKGNEKMIMKLGIKNKEKLKSVEFLKDNLLPRTAIDKKPQVVFISMLHYQKNYFGYVGIKFEDNKTYKKEFESWLTYIANAIENIRIREELTSVLYQLEDLYIRDPLTNLYNRRALSVLAEKYLEQSTATGKQIMVLTADLDGLKEINDKYGHGAGDIAINGVADALKIASDDDELCIRSGGDEFIVIGLEYNQKKLGRFIEQFSNELDRNNRESGNEFDIETSYGYHMVFPDEKTELADVINISDKRMYEQKYKKRLLKKIT